MPLFPIIKSVFLEYGISWVCYRALYSAKLQLLCRIPQSERLFEKNVSVKRIDIFKTDINTISSFLNGLSQNDKESILQVANNAIIGRIKCFSSVTLNYGFPINWQLNPMSGKSCSVYEKWYRIKDFDKERGDIKLIWEASRFTHFYFFARAFMITHDNRYYKAFSEQLDDWLKNNPYSYGANYKCGQECAIRMINTLRAYSVFEAYKLVDEKVKADISELVSRCYRKILSNFYYAHKCIKNNHTLSELCGIIIGAWCCGDSYRLKKAYRLFEKEIERQFTFDGGYRQFSFNYQRFALQICECVISLSSLTGIKLCDSSIERIKKSALLMYQCQSESGDLPNYGSNDGALLFPLTCCDYRDFRPVINTIFALTEGKRVYQHGIHDEELFWFGCGDIEMRTIKCESNSFPEAGLYTLRNEECLAMICLNNFNSRPAHMDQLHFDLWYKGKNIFCDCGTFSYSSELGEELVLTDSHNTLKVSGIEQMNKRGKFMICNWTKADGISKSSSQFEGTILSQNGYKHKRRVELSDNTYRLTDEFDGSGEYEILFHTPFSVLINGNKAIITDEKTLLCTLISEDCVMYTSVGYRSLYYLAYEKISVLHIKSNNKVASMKIKIGVNRND